MTYRGVIRGNSIQATGPLPFKDGEQVEFTVEPTPQTEDHHRSREELFKQLSELPRPTKEDVDEFMRLIREGRTPPKTKGVFDHVDPD